MQARIARVFFNRINTLRTKASEFGWRTNDLKADAQTLEKCQHMALLFCGRKPV